ncbi:MAG: hypothetical protein NC039_09090 [Muribaculaceae bacterium]|nr:hypothetical protein [Muribaculaceae bacterium]
MKQIYFNPIQLQFQWIAAHTMVAVCGRRTGKTHGIAAPFLLRCVQRMPGCTGGIVVPTFLHGLTNTIPGMLTALGEMGLVEGIHYVIGRQPPSFFAKPIIKPATYQHAISFYNGTTVILLSQDRSYSANSLTLSFLIIDEAKFIDFQKLKDQTFPANGGIKSHFGRRSCNHAVLILSDMPQTKKGSWFLHYREKMDPRLIEAIKGQVNELTRLRKRLMEESGAARPRTAPAPTTVAQDLRDCAVPATAAQDLRDCAVPSGKNTPPSGTKAARLLRQIRRLDRELNQLRSVAVYYKECSSIENIELIGEKYIRQMKRDLTPLTFRTSIMCERLGQAVDGFYNCFTEAHKYNASDLPLLDKIFTEQSQQGGFTETEPPEARSCSVQTQSVCSSGIDADLDPDSPICIGMDYNANINWIVAGQPTGRRLNVLKSFYVKFQDKIPELVAKFCTYYQRQRRRHVIFYYDSTALGQNYFVNDRDIRAVVITEFQKRGWTVTDVYIGSPMRHDEKYRLINYGFTGHGNLTPYFNRQNNDDLILAMECAGVERGRLGFRKDKAGEKLPESEENLLEHRTDGTDAFDTLYIGCERFPRTPTRLFIPASVL